MSDPVDINQLILKLKRIYALPINRSTLREVQNAILFSANHNTDIANALLHALVTGTTVETKKHDLKEKMMHQLIDKFTPKTQIAKDVFERGEFLSIATSDVITQNNRVGFINRIKRIDGEELQFISDIPNTLQLVRHYANRLKEGRKKAGGKELIEQLKEELESVKVVIDELLTN